MKRATGDKQARYRVIQKTTLIGALVNVLLAAAQLIGGVVAHSQALFADGMHTLSDLASDFIVLFAAKIASKDADEDHPYGHGRFETLATVILGLILSGVAIGIATTAVDHLFYNPVHTTPQLFGLVFAALAIISKEGLYQYTLVKAKQINSDLLKANAWHHRSDAISSIMVFVGLAGAIAFQVTWLDSLAAIFVAIMIFVMGLRLVIDSVNELLDSAVDPDTVKKISKVITQLEGVENLHMLRTRMLGGQIYADVHIQVASYISVSEGHLIAEHVISALSQQFAEMEDITIHIDPEDDEVAASSAQLPSRETIEQQLQPLLAQFHLLNQVVKMQLHYLEGCIEVEIFLAKTQETSTVIQVDSAEFCLACEQISNIRSVQLHQQL